MIITPSLRRAALAIGIALPLLGAALPVHLRLEKSDPAAGSTVKGAQAIQLWFSQQPEFAATKVTLTSARGDTIPTGSAAKGEGEDPPVRIPLAAPLADGAYTVAWRTMSRDGHLVRGTFAFTVMVGRP